MSLTITNSQKKFLFFYICFDFPCQLAREANCGKKSLAYVYKHFQFDNLQTRNSFIYIYIAFLQSLVMQDIPTISNKSPAKRHNFSSNDFVIVW